MWIVQTPVEFILIPMETTLYTSEHAHTDRPKHPFLVKDPQVMILDHFYTTRLNVNNFQGAIFHNFSTAPPMTKLIGFQWIFSFVFKTINKICPSTFRKIILLNSRSPIPILKRKITPGQLKRVDLT